jgi:hypothetical protein
MDFNALEVNGNKLFALSHVRPLCVADLGETGKSVETKSRDSDKNRMLTFLIRANEGVDFLQRDRDLLGWWVLGSFPGLPHGLEQRHLVKW